MKRRLKDLAVLGLIIAAIGVVVLVSGVFPIKASSGHWAVTRWVLDYASDRSIAFHSVGIDVPTMGEPGLITLGAAVYESNCRFCHGVPGEEQPPVAKGMTPTPPSLASPVSTMSEQELFYVLKHGIKFAGMPAWPTQDRDDEIWSVVAFLKELPSLEKETYRELVRPDSSISQVDSPVVHLVIQQCAACHGVDGNGRAGPRAPLLSGQKAVYLRKALADYRSGERPSGIMMPIAHRLTTTDIEQLADYFSNQKRESKVATGELEDNLIAEGRRMAEQGDQQDKIPSCVDCHGPGVILRSDAYPKLAGQPAWYLNRQLELFAQRKRGGSESASLMHPIADKLTDSQRRALAAYYQDAQFVKP